MYGITILESVEVRPHNTIEAGQPLLSLLLPKQTQYVHKHIKMVQSVVKISFKSRANWDLDLSMSDNGMVCCVMQPVNGC